MRSIRPHLATLTILLGIAAIWASVGATELDAGWLRGRRNCCSSCPCPACSNAVLNAGDLQIHVVGEKHDTVEVFFKNDLFYREQMSGAPDLQCGGNVAPAPPSDLGTFAIRFGDKGDRVKVYGWTSSDITGQSATQAGENVNSTRMASQELAGIDSGYPVRLTWITTAILKVQHGPNCSKELLVRFNGSNAPGKAWPTIFSTP